MFLHSRATMPNASAGRDLRRAQIKDQSPLPDAMSAGLLARCSLPRRSALDAGFDAAQARLANLLHSGALITSSMDYCVQGMTGPVRVGALARHAVAGLR